LLQIAVRLRGVVGISTAALERGDAGRWLRGED